MRFPRLRRPSPALAIAVLALVVALGGSPPSAFQGRIRWAVVNTSGTVVDQSGGIASPTVHSGGSSTYVIDFGADLSHKALLVTPNGPTAQPVSAQVNDSTHAQVTVGTTGGSFYIAVLG